MAQSARRTPHGGDVVSEFGTPRSQEPQEEVLQIFHRSDGLEAAAGPPKNLCLGFLASWGPISGTRSARAKCAPRSAPHESLDQLADRRDRDRRLPTRDREP